MNSQRLKTLNDFLKRAELIPHALLIITKDNCPDCEKAIQELRSHNFEISFYELNISDNPTLEKDLEEKYGIDNLPTFIYFKGTYPVRQMPDLEDLKEFSYFLTASNHYSL